MCGRYQIDAEPEALAAAVRAMPDDALLDMPRRFNIAPTQPVPIARERHGGRRLELVHWGLVPAWAKDVSIGNRMINVRSETAAEKPAFRPAMKYRRCLVPATGFYEWKALGRRKQPYLIRRADGRPLAFAGLWEHWQDPAGNELESCAILTTDARGPVAELHDRMPVILPEESWPAWLDPDRQDEQAAAEIAAGARPPELVTLAVNPRLNNPRHEGPACAQPVQGTLW